MRLTKYLLAFLITTTALADAVIYNGSKVKTLRPAINLNDIAFILTGTADPSSVATDGKKGSLYLRQGATGALYIKSDDGLTTGWAAPGGIVNLATGVTGILANANTTATSAANNSTIVSRNVAGNSNFNNVGINTTAVVSAAQTIAMTYASTGRQRISGASTVRYDLPDATYMTAGDTFVFNNNSTGAVSVYKFDNATLVASIPGGGYTTVICTDNSSQNGQWDFHNLLASGVVSGTTGTTIPGTLSATSMAAGLGSSGAPAYSFTGDLTTGMYSSGASAIDFTVGGSLVSTISATGLLVSPSLRTSAGSAGTPSLSFSGDPDTGFFDSTANTLSTTVGGTVRSTLNTTGLTLTVPVVFPAGTAALPSHTFSGDTNTGIYSTVADVIEFTTGGTSRANISSIGVLSTNGVYASNGDVILSPVASGAKLTTTLSNGTNIVGTTTNDNTCSGCMGEYLEQTLTFASRTALTTFTAKSITSALALTSGDWDIDGTVCLLPNATTSVTKTHIAITKTTNSTPTGVIGLPSGGEMSEQTDRAAFVNGSSEVCFNIGPVRSSLASSQNYFVTMKASFTVSTLEAWGSIRARRVR